MEQCTICGSLTQEAVRCTLPQIAAAEKAGIKTWSGEPAIYASWWVCPSCLKKVEAAVRRCPTSYSQTASRADGAHDKLNQLAAQSQKALDYLDQCKDWTFEEFVKVNRIAETNTTEAELRKVWDNAVMNIAPLGGEPGGKEYLRVTTRKTLVKAVDTFVSMGAKRPSPQPAGCAGVLVLLVVVGILAAVLLII